MQKVDCGGNLAMNFYRWQYVLRRHTNISFLIRKFFHQKLSSVFSEKIYALIHQDPVKPCFRESKTLQRTKDIAGGSGGTGTMKEMEKGRETYEIMHSFIRIR